MSTDASLFSLHFWDAEIFCENCQLIRKFKIFSQEKYDKHYGKRDIPPHKPLYCKCIACDGWMIYATDEFAELQEEPTLGLCKIWGIGPLEAGDLVYHPEEKLCTVEAVNRVSGALPQITLKNKKDEKHEIQLEALHDEEHNLFYRLFPENAADARIGDHIYNTETQIVGTVVGLEFNGRPTLVIKFESGFVDRCHCEKNAHYMTDKMLELNAKWRCKDLPYSQNLQINSRAKVLFISCLVPNFNAACELEKIIASIPQTRCSLIHVVLEKANILASEIYRELLKKFIYICCCKVEIENQEVYIAGIYNSKETPKNIHYALQKFPFKKINLNLRMRSDAKIIKILEEKDWFIRISKVGKDVHMDGWVRTEKQRKRAKWIAFFYTFKLKVENHLWVIN